MRVGDLPTPALVVDLDAVDRNVDVMAAVRPGPMLRSHVKAHKCTALARHVAERSGSTGFCCATVREMPPTWVSASITVTSRTPARCSSSAAVRPAGPPPTITTPGWLKPASLAPRQRVAVPRTAASCAPHS